MPWEFTDDVETYAAHAWQLLCADPVIHTGPLTLVENLRAGAPAGPTLFGWYEGIAAMHLTPPYELVVTPTDDDVLGELARQLRDRGTQVPGVTGDASTAERFARAWTAGTDLTPVVTMREHLNALSTLVPPEPPPPGRPRLATAQDAELLTRWWAAFQREAGVHVVDPAPLVARRTADRQLWLWEDAAGQPVALAGRHRPAAGVVRVGPVYTPAQHRRCGYASGATAAATQDALDAGAEHVVLFTDAANPTSNGVYQRLGYRPVRDLVVLRFASP